MAKAKKSPSRSKKSAPKKSKSRSKPKSTSRRKIIQTAQAPQAIGPYSQAVQAGDFLFCSGQIPLDPATGQVIAEGVEGQTRRVMENIRGVLEAAGLGFEDIVKTTIFLKSMNDFPVVNAAYGSYFPTEPPARSTVEVARLPRDVLVEIEVVGFRG